VYEPPKLRTGDYLGHLTNDLEEFGSCYFIQEFMAGVLKEYAPRQENVRPNAR